VLFGPYTCIVLGERKLLRKSFSGILLILLLISMFALAFNIRPAKTESTTIIVPDDYLTIQEAINAANPQDTVFVKAGTYYEHVIVNKTVSLIGESMETTTIDGNTTTSGTAITITADNVTLSEFRVQRADYNIAVLNCRNAKIYNNSLGSGHYKIFLQNAEDCIVRGNTIIGGWKGIALVSSNHDKIIDNEISMCNSYTFPIGPFYGLSLENSTVNNIEDNLILNCDIGIGLTESGDNIIQNNTVSGDWPASYPAYEAETGLVLKSNSNNNTIIENEISNMTVTAIRLSQSSSIIFHNSFVNNTQQAQVLDSPDNSWDDGYPSGGNCWSDYFAWDIFSGPYQNETGSDGIGDLPYIIDAENQDHYPFALLRILGDVNGDGYVGIDDIFLIASHFGQERGQPGWDPIYDISSDGYIGIDDIFIAAAYFGKESLKPHLTSAPSRVFDWTEPRVGTTFNETLSISNLGPGWGLRQCNFTLNFKDVYYPGLFLKINEVVINTADWEVTNTLTIDNNEGKLIVSVNTIDDEIGDVLIATVIFEITEQGLYPTVHDCTLSFSNFALWSPIHEMPIESPVEATIRVQGFLPSSSSAKDTYDPFSFSSKL
jgi:parallel beta-helix repeat protein